MHLDVLAFGAHPDDVEISAGGTVAQLVASGKKVGIIDLTRGDLGTRGSAELRTQEAAKSAEILGASARENLDMPDGFFGYTEENQRKIIRMVRKYTPDIVLANSLTDRHPDHGKGARLVADACFLAGLRKIETELDGVAQTAHRPRAIYHYSQDRYLKPDIVVDVTSYFDKKMEAIAAFGSQFFNPNSTEPKTPISGSEFFEFIKARCMDFGRPSGFLYGEGFQVERSIGVTDITVLH